MKAARVKPSEWIAGASGLLVLVALFLPWHGGQTALSSFGATGVLMALVGLGGLAFPIVSSASRMTNVPVATETMVSELATISFAALVFQFLLGDEGGFGAGFYLALVATLMLTVSGWKSANRES